MEKKLPKVFANDINKSLTNNDRFYYGKEEKPKSKIPISQKINKIFSSTNYVYKADVDITLNSGKVSKKIIGRNKTDLITMDNELIKISDIIDIEFSE
ncbi:MAG: hypothetical protein RSB71_03580 [Bacilli bacterium]